MELLDDAMALTAGVKLPKRRQNLNALLISFGHELHSCGKLIYTYLSFCALGIILFSFMRFL